MIFLAQIPATPQLPPLPEGPSLDSRAWPRRDSRLRAVANSNITRIYCSFYWPINLVIRPQSPKIRDNDSASTRSP